jgi:thymidylate synthase
MRSNDVIFGYRNDYAWAKHVQTELYNELLTTYPDLELGDIIWTASSLHIYERHFNVLEESQ